MNDGSYFSSSENNWIFEFTDQSREHLADHPIVCKAPGDRNFWAITPEHKLWSAGQLFDHGLFNELDGEAAGELPTDTCGLKRSENGVAASCPCRSKFAGSGALPHRIKPPRSGAAGADPRPGTN
jgi:hypothetical protein